MTSVDYSFAAGLLKTAVAQEQAEEKVAYSKRLTELLQRKGKLPASATTSPPPTISSFPKIADFSPLVLPAAGAAVGGGLGYLSGQDEDPEKEHKLRNALIGALLGGGAGAGAVSLMTGPLGPQSAPTPPRGTEIEDLIPGFNQNTPQYA